MSYRLNKTNGELLVELVDGQIDNTSTDITLVGRNYKGFGEFLNENYIKLLENFAKTSAPGNPLTGQLWYDTSEERLKLYDGETFKSAGGAVVSSSQPNLVLGDLWIDSLNNKLYFFDGADLVLVGPNYSDAQGKTGFEAVTVLDTQSQDRTVMFFYIAGTLAGILSTATFVPLVNITGFPLDPDDTSTPRRQKIKLGFNPVSVDFWFRGTAESTSSLIDVNTNETYTVDKFMKTNDDTQTTGGVKIKNLKGLTIGDQTSDYLTLTVSKTTGTSFIDTQISNKDFAIRTRRGNAQDNAFYVDADNKRVGIFTSAPATDFDLTGSARITGNMDIEGNLTVGGDLTYLDVSNLRVEDKNIELGITSDSTLLDDSQMDGAGIIVRVSGNDKTITWEYETDNWTSSNDWDLVSGKSYKIDNVVKLSENRLHNSVIYAEGLVSIGTLLDLEVDNFTFDGSTITVSDPLNISSSGIITINNQKITGVTGPADSDGDTVVANKGYVDTQIDKEPVVTSLDTTGLNNPTNDFNLDGPYNDVKDLLEFLYPASEKENGTVARIVCTSYTGATVSGIDIESTATKSYISVLRDPEDSSTPEEESVVQDINFSTASGVANLSALRAKMEFIVNAGVWQFVRTTPL
jgi:hypothetical protein